MRSQKARRSRREKKYRERRPIWDRLPYGVRQCGGRWQLRVWFGGHKNAHFNFGSYPSIYAADRVGRKAVELKKQGLDYLQVLARLKASGDVPAQVMPRYVYEREDGKFGAWCRWPVGDGRTTEIRIEPFDAAEDAYRAMEAEFERRAKQSLPAGRRFTTSDYQGRE